MTRTPRMDTFTRSYFETALWSSNDESNEQGGEPLDRNYGVEDFAPETRDKMIADCADFQERFGELIGGETEQAGHDFWLTRNRHGAGFWDGDWEEPYATKLTDASKEYGEYYLYVGDDGLIYGPPPGAYGVRERGRPRRGRRAQETERGVVGGDAVRGSPSSMGAGHHIAPGYPAERFRIGQDVAMISNPTIMGHVVGFDQDGSVMVQWHGTRAVSGVDARNLRGLPPSYAGRRELGETPRTQWPDWMILESVEKGHGMSPQAKDRAFELIDLGYIDATGTWRLTAKGHRALAQQASRVSEVRAAPRGGTRRAYPRRRR